MQRIILVGFLFALLTMHDGENFNILIAPKHRAEVETAIETIDKCFPEGYQLFLENIRAIDYSDVPLPHILPLNPQVIFLSESQFQVPPIPSIFLAQQILHETRHAWQLRKTNWILDSIVLGSSEWRRRIEQDAGEYSARIFDACPL